MANNKITLGYDDISIVPEQLSRIRHRNECDCYTDTASLPIFVAPMDNVIDEHSANIFIDEAVNVVYPRTIPLEKRVKMLGGMYYQPWKFIAFSLTEVQNIFIDEESENINCEYNFIYRLREMAINSFYSKESNAYAYRICIDVANGHMKELIDTIKAIKRKYGDRIIIMSGNIANPETYRYYEHAGCDFVRCSIGSGSRCTTSSNTAIHYGCFSLLKEIWTIKQKIQGKCKIIADGGIKGYGDIQKALLYADYVMIGSLFNKAIDSAGIPRYGCSYWNIFGKRVINPFKTLFTYGKAIKHKYYEKVLKEAREGKLDIWKEYYGMSTKIAQLKINPGGRLKTSEGKVEHQKVE